MAKLPKGPPTLRDVLREQRSQARLQGTSSPFDGTGITVDGNGNMTLPGTLTAGTVKGYAPTSYVDAATAMYGMEAPYAALAIPATTVTTIPWGAPTENNGGFVVSGGVITIPQGLGGVYTVTVSYVVSPLQSTGRAFVNLTLGSRAALRGVFLTDASVGVSGTARLADLSTVSAAISMTTAGSAIGGWITLYRLHS